MDGHAAEYKHTDKQVNDDGPLHASRGGRLISANYSPRVENPQASTFYRNVRAVLNFTRE